MTEINWPTAAEWAEELRTTDKEQGSHQLHNADFNTFCCLGVLCDMIDPNAWVADTWHGGLTTLPVAYRPDWLLGRGGVAMDLNDDKGKSFVEIADWIDEGMPVT